MRGLFTSGVLDVFMENDINFDKAVGVSAGVAFGCNFKSRQIGRALRYNIKYADNWHYKSMRSLFVTGDLFGASFCYHELPEKLDVFDTKTFEENPLEFYCVATDVTTGDPVYKLLHDCKYDDCEWVRASSSMPLASQVVELDGMKLLDGGISDSIPLEFMEKQGCDKNLVVLTQPYDFTKMPYKHLGLISTALHKYPQLVRALRERPTMYNAELAYVKVRETEGSAFVLRPPEALNIGALEKDESQIMRVYNTGRKVAEDNLDKIRDFLS